MKAMAAIIAAAALVLGGAVVAALPPLPVSGVALSTPVTSLPPPPDRVRIRSAPLPSAPAVTAEESRDAPGEPLLVGLSSGRTHRAHFVWNGRLLTVEAGQRAAQWELLAVEPDSVRVRADNRIGRIRLYASQVHWEEPE